MILVATFQPKKIGNDKNVENKRKRMQKIPPQILLEKLRENFTIDAIFEIE